MLTSPVVLVQRDLTLEKVVDIEKHLMVLTDFQDMVMRAAQETDKFDALNDDFDALNDEFDYASIEIDALLKSPNPNQIGGGIRREPTPEQLTPTRLRPRINASLRGRDSAIVNNARVRRAQMAGAPVQDTSVSSDAGSQHPPPRSSLPHSENQPAVPPLDGGVPVGTTRMYDQLRPTPQNGPPSGRYLSPPQAADGRPYILPPIYNTSDLAYDQGRCPDYSRSTTCGSADTRHGEDYRPPSRQLLVDARYTNNYEPPLAHVRDNGDYDHQSLSILPHEARPDNYFHYARPRLPSVQPSEHRPSSAYSERQQPSVQPSEHQPLSAHSERRQPSVQPFEHRPLSAHSERRQPSVQLHEHRPQSPEHHPPSTQPSALHGLHQSPSAQPLPIPATTITPPTPIRPDDHPQLTKHGGVPAYDDAANNIVNDPAHLFNDLVMEPGDDLGDKTQSNAVDAGVGASGRLSDATKDVRDEGFKDIEKMFATLAQRTSIDISRLTSGYFRSFTNKTVAFHSWNTYQIYFKDHRDEEVKRTYPPERKVDLDNSSEVAIRQSCFDSFKHAHPKHWQDILSKYHDLHLFSAAGKTVAQRTRTFKKIGDRLEALADSSAAQYGFQVAIVMAGEVVNEDASLGRMYETEGAKDFFAVRCRADEHAIVAHLKAHSFNAQSLKLIDSAWCNVGGSTVKEAMTVMTSQTVTLSEYTLTSNFTENIQYLRESLIALLNAVATGWQQKKNQFPWQRLPVILGDCGVVLENYPHTVPLPIKSAKVNPKGINDLKGQEVKDLYEAINSKTFPLRFRRLPEEMMADLKESKIPVIIGAPPPPDVREKYGRRVFFDGKIDNKGPERLAPSKRQTADANSKHNTPGDASDSDDVLLDQPQHRTQTTAQPSKTVTEPSCIVVIPQKPGHKKVPTVKKSRSIIDDDDDDDDISIISKHSVSDREPHPGVKRKPEQRDGGGVKKKVHIVVSDDSGDVENDKTLSDDDGKGHRIRKGKNPAAKTTGKSGKKGSAPTVQHTIAGGKSTSLGSPLPADQPAEGDSIVDVATAKAKLRGRPKPRPTFRGASERQEPPGLGGNHPSPTDMHQAEQTRGADDGGPIHSGDPLTDTSIDRLDHHHNQHGGRNVYGPNDPFMQYGGALPYRASSIHAPAFRDVYPYTVDAPLHPSNPYYAVPGFHDTGYPFYRAPPPGQLFPNYQGQTRPSHHSTDPPGPIRQHRTTHHNRDRPSATHHAGYAQDSRAFHNQPSSRSPLPGDTN